MYMDQDEEGIEYWSFLQLVSATFPVSQKSECSMRQLKPYWTENARH